MLEKEAKENLRNFKTERKKGDSLGTIRNKEEYAVAYSSYRDKQNDSG